MTRASLRILGTSDLHMHLLGVDYAPYAETPGKGLAPLASRISQLRADAPGECLLLDNGDLLQGNALGEHIAKLEPEGPHPVADVMNRLGYDAMGLGNHDLDFGLDPLEWFARSLTAPLISSNALCEPRQDWLHPYTILPAGDLRVGILAVLPVHSAKGLHAFLDGRITIDSMVDAARDTVKHLRDQGADVVIVLAHTGIGADHAENALEPIAQLDGVDAIIGGHTHHVFPGPDHASVEGTDMEAGTLHGTPLVMPGCEGQCLGCIDLDLVQGPDSGWRIIKQHASVHQSLPSDESMPEAFAPLSKVHRDTNAALDRSLGKIQAPLTSYFSQITPTRLQALVASAQVPVIEEARAGTEYADLPLLSAVSLPRAGGRGGPGHYTDIAAGLLRERDLSSIQSYTNLIWAVQIIGAELRAWLEKSAETFNQVTQEGQEGLINPSVPSFQFDVIYGITYHLDPLQKAGARVSGLSFDGKAVSDDDPFLVAVNNYRACGGGLFPGLTPNRPVLRPTTTTSEAIRGFVQDGREPIAPSPWRFADSCAGVSTWIETGPGAEHHLTDIAALNPGKPQPQPSGFLRIPVTL